MKQADIERMPGTDKTHFLNGDARRNNRSIGPGDFVGYPEGGEAHAMINTGDELLVRLVVGERLAHDAVDYPRRGKRLFRQAGLHWQLVDVDAIEEPDAGAK